MGRRQLPLEGDSPAELFAMRLRKARADSGMTVRVLARRSGYSASTLSQAESGRRVPTWEVVRTFVQACGEDPAQWRRLWESANSGRPAAPPQPQDGPDPRPGTTSSLGGDSAGGQPPATAAPEDTGPPLSGDDAPPDTAPSRSGYRALPEASVRPRFSGRRRTAPAVTAGVLAFAAALAGASQWLPHTGHDTAAEHAQAGGPSAQRAARRAVNDGTDPIQAGCADQVTTLQEQPVRNAQGTTLGSVQVRFSAACDGAWARFHPSKAFDPRSSVLVTVTAVRPADSNRSEFAYRFDGRDVYTDLLIVTRHCVTAQVRIALRKNLALTAKTRCAAHP
ncbi:helix-turn-helix domain-containing protein [Streptomyces sp. MC1]|uniref:helix-turn-helix domain-containing protein n=1 Tax=Streptomyces sp. MC1 TaxID=295105 RepID=UPI0018CBB29B|nr:XRE family transcriptional regulator [Streptomyces sp. MC1]MBG7702426.1 helix-turn-helix domain-containing protein [Streptomyces sp. MC1]